MEYVSLKYNREQNITVWARIWHCDEQEIG